MPRAPRFLDGLEVLTADVMRVQDQKLHSTSVLVPINAKQGVGQNTSTNHDGSALGVKVMGDLSGPVRDLRATAKVQDATGDTVELLQTQTDLKGPDPLFGPDERPLFVPQSEESLLDLFVGRS